MFDRSEKLVKGISQKLLSNRSVIYNYKPENITLTVECIFTNEYLEVTGVTTTHPVVRIDGDKLSRRPSIKDLIVIDGVTWKVVDVRDEKITNAFTILVKKA